MVVDLQWHAGVVRGWINPAARYGEPYDWICFIDRDPLDPLTAVLSGAMSAPPRVIMRALIVKLIETGFRSVAFERRTKNGARWKRFELSTLAAQRAEERDHALP